MWADSGDVHYESVRHGDVTTTVGRFMEMAISLRRCQEKMLEGEKS